MTTIISVNSIDSDVFFVEQLSSESTTNKILKSWKIHRANEDSHKRDADTLFNYTPEPDIVTSDDDFNDPIIPYGFGVHQPIVPPNLNDINLPPNPVNIIATMAVDQPSPTDHNDNYSPQSPEPSESPPNSAPPMNLGTIDSWETPHTTTGDNIFFSEDEPSRVHGNSSLDDTFHSEGETRRVYPLPSLSPRSSPRKMERKLEMGMSFPRRRGVSQHLCEAYRQMIPQKKDSLGPSTTDWNSTYPQVVH